MRLSRQLLCDEYSGRCISVVSPRGFGHHWKTTFQGGKAPLSRQVCFDKLLKHRKGSDPPTHPP